MNVEAEFERLILRIVPDLEREWRGATPEEIDRIERVAGRPLPPFYRWFLSRMGAGMGGLSYPTMDFSAAKILSCYDEHMVLPDPRFLMIAFESDEVMPLHLFYDLDTSALGDARVTNREAKGDECYDQFDTLREMLAWGALLQFRIETAPQRCLGVLKGDDLSFLLRLDAALTRTGFSSPIPTASCRLYERSDATLITGSTPGLDAPSAVFRLGGSDAGALRKILGAITSASLQVDIDEWSPELP